MSPNRTSQGATQRDAVVESFEHEGVDLVTYVDAGSAHKARELNTC